MGAPPNVCIVAHKGPIMSPLGDSQADATKLESIIFKDAILHMSVSTILLRHLRASSPREKSKGVDCTALYGCARGGVR